MYEDEVRKLPTHKLLAEYMQAVMFPSHDPLARRRREAMASEIDRRIPIATD